MSAEIPTIKQLEYFVCIAELKTFRGVLSVWASASQH